MKGSYTKVYKYKVDRNHFIVIKIYQNAFARTQNGNALASNAVNVKIFKPATAKPRSGK
ncbi:hypothetical protein [Paenibacillus physcomitrellae]|uniref:Uncharacterized protein n=1 Tax=Paenibacillus physcomitrellae TaxID=1619311 RepID=A0ABQ1GRL9_9BACL|nr:hypothetical protein [Paenibacillus physcomitrellae]GGA49069.1 hypothetical protein GCM10010917_37960 [Paenibacillus physcomitrellae]